jgi:hypothetical protein
LAIDNGNPLRLSCKRCESPFEFLRATGKKGRPPSYCGAECLTDTRRDIYKKDYAFRKANGLIRKPVEPYKRGQCRDCSALTVNKGARCRDCHSKARRLQSACSFYCEWCGASAYRNLSQKLRAANAGNRWCSQRCRSNNAAHVRAEIEALKRIRVNNKPKRTVKDWAENYKEQNPHVWAPRPCVVCSILFSKPYGMKARRSYCSEECIKEAKRRRGRIHKSARRAKIRGSRVERVDPLKVFERDGWRCHICRCPTPKRLRGTYLDKAPELDHVMPLALGGSHTWGNVACACRACNQSKGARPLGQLGLELAA